jgi:hypothetical protein
MAERLVVLTLAGSRAAWSRELVQLAAAGALALDVVRCLSAEEVRVRLGGGRRWSAVVVDGGLPALERDLIAACHEARTVVAVVADPRVRRDWAALGADVVIEEPDPHALAEAIGRIAVAVPEPTDVPPMDRSAVTGGAGRTAGRLVAVTGVRGSGRSTLACALAEHAARPTRRRGAPAGPHDAVVLVDACLHADLGVLHAARDVVPGLPELVEAHRIGTIDRDAVHRLTWEVPARGYRLLLGLRRHRDWATLRPRAVAAALDGLRAAFTTVVVDVDADVEGEAETGSLDVEDRNLLARVVLAAADVVVCTAPVDVRGLVHLNRIAADLAALGVDGARLVVAATAGPGRPPTRRLAQRAAAVRAAADAVGAAGIDPAAIVVVPRRDDLATRTLDVASLADHAVAVADAVGALLARTPDRSGPAVGADVPVAVTPGSLGSWADDDDHDERFPG